MLKLYAKAVSFKPKSGAIARASNGDIFFRGKIYYSS